MAPVFDLPVIPFKDVAALRRWFTTHHMRSEGIWIKFAKKGSGKASVTYAEAVDEALCHGWIDGQRRTYDERSYVNRFTPRRPRSIWSSINKGHVARLIKEGRMTSAGLRAVDAAKADGRWRAAYDPQRSTTVPADFLKALGKRAAARFAGLPKAEHFAVHWRLQTAKRPETRAKRMAMLVDLFKRGGSLHGKPGSRKA